MTITNPAHWIEQGKFTGDKYDKILEMIAELNTPTATPADHAAEHQNGGGDEINVGGLSGLLGDGQTPLAHKTSHQDGGSDEIDGNLDLGGLKLGSTPSSFLTSVQTAMPGSPTDVQILTAQGIEEHIRTNNISANGIPEINLFNGASISATGANAVLLMPASDADCGFRYNLHIPHLIIPGQCTLYVRYRITTTDAYSVKWRITSLGTGTISDYNVWNDELGEDFPAGTANDYYIKNIALIDTDIDPSKTLGVYIQSRASNGGALYIYDMWIGD